MLAFYIWQQIAQQIVTNKMIWIISRCSLRTTKPSSHPWNCPKILSSKVVRTSIRDPLFCCQEDKIVAQQVVVAYLENQPLHKLEDCKEKKRTQKRWFDKNKSKFKICKIFPAKTAKISILRHRRTHFRTCQNIATPTKISLIINKVSPLSVNQRGGSWMSMNAKNGTKMC